MTRVFSWGSPRKSTAAPERKPAAVPVRHPCCAISAQIARKMGEGFEAADLGVRHGPHVARILEPKTLNSLEFFPAVKFCLGRAPVVRLGL
jgi:hypothetical protein